MYYVTIPPLTWHQRLGKFAKSYTGIMTWISMIALVWAFFYKYMFVNIPAKWDFMPILGEIFFAVVLSIVASTIVLVVTIYVPGRKKQKKVDVIVMPWLKQYRLLGDMIQIAVAGKSGASHEEFKSRCTHDLMSPITNQSVALMAGRGFANWFDFFNYIFEQEEIYYGKLIPYFDSLPIEVLEDMEDLLMPDRLRGALITYQSHYGTGFMGIDYNHLTNLEKIIWQDATRLRNLVVRYQLCA